MIDALGTPQRIALMGGTSDIGLAIVRRLFRERPGQVVLAARPSERRAEAQRSLEARGIGVRPVDLEATDLASHEGLVRAVWADGDVDVVILAFGVLADNVQLLSDRDRAVELATVNYTAAMSIGLAVTPRFRDQGHGAIVALSSVAAQRPRPANFVYGSSKAGLDAFFYGLADHLHGTGVHVLVVRPGFVRSKMTSGLKTPPLASTPDAVAEAVARALPARVSLVWVPRPLRWVMALLTALPRAVWRRLPM